MKIEKKSTLSIIIIILVLITVIVCVYKIADLGTVTNATPALRTYQIKNLDLTFNYPKDFTVLEQVQENSTTSPVLLALSSNRGQINLTFSTLFTEEAKREKSINDKTLFLDVASKMKNSKITIVDFEGYKSLVDFNRSEYLVYKNVTSASSLRVQIKTYSDVSGGLLDMENDVISILNSISFK